VEALQFLKCLIRRDLVFRTDLSISLDTDLEEDKLLEDDDPLTPETEKSAAWDEVWLDVGLSTVPVYGYDRKLYGHQTGTDRTVSEPYSW
jgi:hypothetical protein